MHCMVPCLREYKDVVQIYNDVDTLLVLEDVIYHMLEGHWCIGESKVHHHRFV
jgi:hypothetical protein